MRSFAIALLTIVLASVCFAQTQKDKQEFHPLQSSSQHSDTTINVLSEARLVDHLISQDALSAMKEEEKKDGYASVYEYTYTIQNTGKVKIKIVFANENVLISPITQIVQDFSIILLPNETKKIKFIANTTPQFTSSIMCFMRWVEEKNKWFVSGYCAASFLYLPKWNALAEEVSY